MYILLFCCVISPILGNRPLEKWENPMSESIGRIHSGAIEQLQSTIKTYNQSLSDLAPFLNYTEEYKSETYRSIETASNITSALRNGGAKVLLAKSSIPHLCNGNIQRLKTYICFVSSDSTGKKAILSNMLYSNIGQLNVSLRKIKVAAMYFNAANELLIVANENVEPSGISFITTLKAKVNEAIDRLDNIKIELQDDINLIKDARVELDNSSGVGIFEKVRETMIKSANELVNLCEAFKNPKWSQQSHTVCWTNFFGTATIERTLNFVNRKNSVFEFYIQEFLVLEWMKF